MRLRHLTRLHTGEGGVITAYFIGIAIILFGLIEHVMTMNPILGFWDFGWFAIAHVAAGLVCVAWFFASGTGSLTEFVRRRSTKYGTNALLYSVLFIFVVVMLNIFGVRYNKRWDMSAAGVNSLTDASRQPAPGSRFTGLQLTSSDTAVSLMRAWNGVSDDVPLPITVNSIEAMTIVPSGAGDALTLKQEMKASPVAGSPSAAGSLSTRSPLAGASEQS